MIGGMVKKLIIVTGEKENVYAELLSSLISINYDNTKNVQVAGTKGESIEAIVWTEKIYNQNKIQLSSNNKIIFVGKTKAGRFTATYRRVRRKDKKFVSGKFCK